MFIYSFKKERISSIKETLVWIIFHNNLNFYLKHIFQKRVKSDEEASTYYIYYILLSKYYQNLLIAK